MMRRGGPVLILAGLLAGCASAPAPADDPATAESPVPVAAPAPPVSCLLDVVALQAATGIAWTAETAGATATRCVYDPAGPAGTVFLAVTLGGADPDTIAQACGTSARQAVQGGFVCRLATGPVLGAVAGNGRVVTVTVSQVPEGTTAEKLIAAIAAQLPALRTA